MIDATQYSIHYTYMYVLLLLVYVICNFYANNVYIMLKFKIWKKRREKKKIIIKIQLALPRVNC